MSAIIQLISTSCQVSTKSSLKMFHRWIIVEFLSSVFRAEEKQIKWKYVSY